MTTPQQPVMPLEEVIQKLKNWSPELLRVAEGKTFWGSAYFEALSSDLSAALHHLEAGKRLRKACERAPLECLTTEHSMAIAEALFASPHPHPSRHEHGTAYTRGGAG